MSDAAWRRIAGIEGVYIGRNFNSVLNGRHCYKAIVNEAVTAANVNITDSAFNDVTSDYIDTANVTTLIPGTTITFKSPIYKLTSSDGSFIFVLDGENATFPYLLNDYPATAAYSLRLLDSTYTGSAIRVRRASDNAEQDIGFSGSDLDTASLTSFCTGTNGFVTTWYDQAGSNNATQVTAGSQPKIYDSSTGVVTENGKPALDFDGVDDNLYSATYTQVGAAALSAFVISQSTPSDNGMTIDFGYDAALQKGAIIGINRYRVSPPLDYVAAGFEGRYDATSNYISGARGGLSTSVQLLTTAITDGTDNIAFSQGIEVGRVGITTPYDFGSGIYIGALNLVGFYSDGIFQEIIIYNTNQSANRTAIESNINSHYNIYP